MKSYIPFTFSLGKQHADQKQLILQQLRARGNGRRPDPPRDVMAQPGSRGALLTWKLPASQSQWVRGWRVYKDTEDNLHEDLADPGRRQIYVALSAGDNPPVTNFFISAIGAAGAESAKVQVQASALAETGAPVVPPPPPGYTGEEAGGGDRAYYGERLTSRALTL